MFLTTLFDALSHVDLAALFLLVVGWQVIGWMIDHPTAARPSVTRLMADRRRAWMREFVARDVRIFDSQILASLRQGTSFFASTNILAIGGILALAGNPAPLAGFGAEVGNSETPELVWQIKLAVVALFLVNAFLKFVWANRVFGYCAVVMAAVPNDPNAATGQALAAQAAALNIRAAVNFNRGLRAMYFALGAIAWLAGPVALILATICVIWLLWAREFASAPRRILLGDVS